VSEDDLVALLPDEMVYNNEKNAEEREREQEIRPCAG
jgi:hypothetical protein